MNAIGRYTGATLFSWLFILMAAVPTKTMSAISTSQTGLVDTASNAGLETAADRTSVAFFAGSLINAALGIIGVIFLVLIVYGGILWMLSEGDENKVGKARGMIFHSIIGLILVLSAYAITSFVIDAVTKGTVAP